ncbi:MAG: hypothetical protein WKI04_20195 [Ferruginibacter sp.]
MPDSIALNHQPDINQPFYISLTNRATLFCYFYALSFIMKLATALFVLFLSGSLFAQDGYEIKVTLKPFTNQYIYLGHYFGKQLPIIDSVKLDEKSEGIFKGSKKLGAGIYMIGYPDRARNFEILIGKVQKFSVMADTLTIAKKINFSNSVENNEFTAYQEFMVINGKAIDTLQKKLFAGAKDSIQLKASIDAKSNSIKKYRKM